MRPLISIAFTILQPFNLSPGDPAVRPPLFKFSGWSQAQEGEPHLRQSGLLLVDKWTDGGRGSQDVRRRDAAALS